MLEHKMDYKVSDRSVSARSALLFVAKVAARLVLRGVSCLSSQLLTQSAVDSVSCATTMRRPPYFPLRAKESEPYINGHSTYVQWRKTQPWQSFHYFLNSVVINVSICRGILKGPNPKCYVLYFSMTV